MKLLNKVFEWEMKQVEKYLEQQKEDSMLRYKVEAYCIGMVYVAVLVIQYISMHR